MIKLFSKNPYKWSTLALLIIGVVAIIGLTNANGFSTLSPKDSSESTKEVYRETLSTIPEDEYSGIVYNGYLLKNIWEDEFGWDIPYLSSQLGIKMVEQESEYPDAILPINFYLQSEQTRLSFKGNVYPQRADYLSFPEGANIDYKVFKDDKEIKLEHTPFTFHGRAPHGDLLEILNALEIEYFKEGSTIYVYSDKPTEIKGKILTESTIELGSNQTLNVKLVYNYQDSENPNYQNIKLLVNGNESTIFDEKNPGSSKYYRNGMVEYHEFQGEEFIQVRLDNDTVVYKYQDGELLPVFTKKDYQQYLNGNLSLETDIEGNAVFIDKVNGFKQQVSLSGAKPNAIFNLNIRQFSRLEVPYSGEKLTLTADAGAVYNGKYFFNLQIEYLYNGKKFIPTRIFSNDTAKMSEDKRDGKLVDSIEDYRRFEYELNGSAVQQTTSNAGNTGFSDNNASNKDWEVVSRQKRVLGTIEKLDATSDKLKSLTLKVDRYIQLPNDPVDGGGGYGRNLNIVFDEKLSNAGVIKDKLQKGTKIVVTVAQYAVPPNGEIVLGAYFNGGTYYQENGKFYDLEGSEVDLIPASDPEFLTKPEVEVPVDLEMERYEQEQVDQGHQPWKLDPVQVTQEYIYNRVSSEGNASINFEVIQKSDRVAIIGVNGGSSPIKAVYLKRMVKQDNTGIWSIVGFDRNEPNQEIIEIAKADLKRTDILKQGLSALVPENWRMQIATRSSGLSGTAVGPWTSILPGISFVNLTQRGE
ncbi:MAG: hypothetical protein PWQ96_161 [Clostridia bacterium]|nr:hypothetical protein [Clostridia bacterium]